MLSHPSPIQRTGAAVFVIFVAAWPAVIAADERAVIFDVPAIVEAVEVTAPPKSSDLRVIELTLPVSALIDVAIDDRPAYAVKDIRYDVFWNRMAYPLNDYAPKSKTESGLAGNIMVEKRADKNTALGLKLNSGFQEVLTGSAQASLDLQRGTTIKYEEIPQHDVLISSGPVKRGTGAFFRFRPSKTETLEGGRDLIVSFKVPHTWRGGVLQVVCQATARRKVVGPWTEPVEDSAVFVVPVYLQGDSQARHFASEFSLSEQRLQSGWVNHFRSDDKRDPVDVLQKLLGGSAAKKSPQLWVRSLIQTGDENWLAPRTLAAYQIRLPERLKSAARDYLSARQEMLSLSR